MPVNDDADITRPPSSKGGVMALRLKGLLDMYTCFAPKASPQLNPTHRRAPAPVAPFPHHGHGDNGIVGGEDRSRHGMGARRNAPVVRTQGQGRCRPCPTAGDTHNEGSGSWKQANATAAPPRVRHVVAGTDAETTVTIDALNKISDDNYPKMLDRIMGCVRAAAAPLAICSAILRKCYEQDFFMGVYLRVLSDVLAAALHDVDRATFSDVLVGFAEETMALDLATTLPRPLPHAGYEGFCARVKAKKHLIGRARVTIGLIQRGLVPTTLSECFERVVATLAMICSLPPTPAVQERQPMAPASEGRHYDDDHADIAIEYLRELMGAKQERTQGRMERISQLLEDCVTPSSSLMCKFKMQGILDMAPNLTAAPVSARKAEVKTTQRRNPPPATERPGSPEQIWQTTGRLRQQLRQLPNRRPGAAPVQPGSRRHDWQVRPS